AFALHDRVSTLLVQQHGSVPLLCSCYVPLRVKKNPGGWRAAGVPVHQNFTTPRTPRVRRSGAANTMVLRPCRALPFGLVLRRRFDGVFSLKRFFTKNSTV